MHIKNENNDTRDTKLVIVGGRNNSDVPMYSVDIYNLTTRNWQVQTDFGTPFKLEANVLGKPLALTDDYTFSILVENNEAKIPALVFYNSNQDPSDSDNDGKNHATSQSDEYKFGHMDTGTDTSTTEKLISPISALPLTSGIKGMRMKYNPHQCKDTLHIPFKMKFPTGDHAGYSIVISGLYPTANGDEFFCFVYDILSGKWSHVGIQCADSDIHKHRYWKVFVWKSHYQTLLLGTRDDDGNLPTVQKFDRILTFGLPLLNLFNKVVLTNPQTLLSATPPITAQNTGGDVAAQQLANQKSYSTSQYESYIRYIAPPADMATTRSIFPPYAMVLGKDALEIYGKPLSDFEFITAEGDSIAIPSYLLRKRWGRYFDMLLAKAYAKVCNDLEATNNPRSMRSFNSSRNSSKSSYRTSRCSSSGYLDSFPSKFKPASSKYSYNSTESKKSFIPEPEPESSDILAGSMESQADDDPVSSKVITSETTLEKNSKLTKSSNDATTSSSSGMVFRVPFRDTIDDKICTEHTPSLEQPKRKPSILSSSSINASKSSQPNISAKHGHNVEFVENRDNYRSPSYSSRSSSMSRSSSTRDRRKSQILRSAKNTLTESFVPGILNLRIPAQSKVPTEPLPPPPNSQDPVSRVKRNHSISGYLNPKINSPFSSRRSSVARRASTPDVKENPLSSEIHNEYVEGRKFQPISNKYSSSGTSTERTSTCEPPMSSNNSSFENDDKLDSKSFDLEPLLTPRSLYMPWPTATVRALAEFFYTGQVNSNWPLAPVVLDLLVLAKLYEIPLLYNLTSEVLYSIVGRKEESLYSTCHSLIGKTKTALLIGNEQNVIDTLSQLEKLKDTIENLDNGFFDLNMITKSRSYSIATHDSDLSNLASNLANDKSNVPVIYSGGPRDSHNSITSIGTPSTVHSSPLKKSVSSNFNKTIRSHDISIHDMNIDQALENDTSFNQQIILNEDEAKTVKKSYNKTSGNTDVASETEHNIKTHDDENDSTTMDESDQDLDDIEVGLEMFSLKKMKKKIREGGSLDDSIDPLTKLEHDSQSSNKLINENPHNSNNLLKLKNIITSKSSAPVDYLVKSIFRTAVLVNDVRLMVRAIDCIELSKDLKEMKKIVHKLLNQ